MLAMSPRSLLSVLLVAILALLIPSTALADDGHPHDDHQATADHPASGADPAIDPAIDPELDVDMKGAPPPSDKAAYAAFLRGALAKARPHVIAKMETKAQTSQATSMNRLSFGMFLFSLSGIFLLFRPFFLLKRYPGRAKTLFGYGALSAGLFFLTVNLFAMVIGLLKTAQGVASHYTNPQIAIVEAAFDVLNRNADDLVELAPKLIEPSLHQMAKGDASFVVVLLENFKGIKSDIDAVLAIAKAVKALDGVLAWIPVVLTCVAIFTFAMSAKDTLIAIVRLPEAAASGGGAGVIIRGALRRVKNELLATLCLIGTLMVLAVGGGVALKMAVEPAVEAFLNTIFLAAITLQVQKVSSATLFGGLGLSALVLVLNVAVVMAASTAALGKLHKIFQRKFHEGLPLSAHGRFWKRAPFALALCFLFPFIYDFLAEKGSEAILTRTLHSAHPQYSAALVGTPAAVCLGFVVCFGVVLGVHSLLFLFRYPVKSIALAPQPSTQGPVPAAFVRKLTRADDADLAIFDRLVAPAARPSVQPMPYPSSNFPRARTSVRVPAPSSMAQTSAPATMIAPHAAPLAFVPEPARTERAMPAPPPPSSDADAQRTTLFRRQAGIKPLPPAPSSQADETLMMQTVYSNPNRRAG